MNVPAPPSAVAPDPGEDLEDTAVLAQIEHVLAEFRHLDIGRAAGPSQVAAPSAEESERRVLPRLGIQRRVGAAVRTAGGRDVGIDLLDASEDGLGIRARARLPLRAEVTVELSRPGVLRPLALAGVVRWCGPAADGTFTVGVRLHRRLTPMELSNLTAGAARANPGS